MSSDIIKQAEENQLKNIISSTGKSLEDWITIIKNSGLNKHGEMVAFLKTTYTMGHGNANLLVHYANKSHAGAESNDDLVAEQYKGKENLKVFYDKIMEQVAGFGDDIEIAPKKAYVSLRRKKQFAIIQPSTKSRLDVGLNLKDTSPQANLEAAGSWNAMCTHRLKVENETSLSTQLFVWMKQAYEQA